MVNILILTYSSVLRESRCYKTYKTVSTHTFILINMALILRVCASAQKRLLLEDFNNLIRAPIYITHNGCNLERFSATHNVKHFSTKVPHEAPTEKTEIYYGILTKQVRGLKIFSLLTSTGGLLAQPLLYTKAVESGNTGAVLGLFACIGFLAVTTPLLIHMITKKYVTHVYYNAKEDKYIANTYNLFVRKKELEFTPDDVVVPDVTGMFTNCIIKGKPLFLEQSFFDDPSHYIRIMGYDKPIDFKLSNNNSLSETVTVNTEYKDDVNKK
ncbi:transmembrane protein 70 homolog, mitochondrial [Linepithema humile]|uniref:transmembrane protein 70 homolog, mitochondrial n=1 Tax=Linepithema humile TaxID=83485 RepID=UPI0006239BEB|nr:PREDICTED: transmembrane protein 70 homolog, mitochondrial [Linepithema humile]